MNIMSISNVNPAFTAKKKKGVKPSKIDNFMASRDVYLNVNSNSVKTLQAKIKYAEKRLKAEEEYLQNHICSWREKRPVEITIMRIKQELSMFKAALEKLLKKV